MFIGLKQLLTSPANKGCRLGMLWRWAGANVWRRFSRKPRIVNLFGYEFVAHPDCSVSYTIAWNKNGLFDYDYMQFFSRFAQADDVIMDIGAHVGAYTLLFASLATNGRVIAVEPSPETFTRLEENVKRNHLAHRVQVVNMALAKEAGFLDFEAQGCSTGNRVSSVDRPGAETVRIRCTTLDELAAELEIARCDFMKIDVEGFEEHVIVGGKDFLERHTPKAILFEANGNCLAYGTDLSEAFEVFARLGYRLGLYGHRENRIALVSGRPPTVSPEGNYLAMSAGFLQQVGDSCAISAD